MVIYIDAVCLSVQFSRDDYISGKYQIAASAYSTSKRREMISTVFFSSLLTQRLRKKSNLIDFRVSPYHPFYISPPPPSYPPISPWKCVESGSRFLCFLSVAISHHSVQQRLFFFCCYIRQQFRSIADELDFFNSPILLLFGGRWTLFEKISIKSYGRCSFLLQRQIWIYVYEWMSSLW